mgnify:CR=1 FL=1
MTNEEFDEILERTNAVVCNREWYERAAKALEQGPVLDKIRNEIKELDDKVCQQWLIEDIDKEVHHTYQECIDIVDKYKVKIRGNEE